MDLTPATIGVIIGLAVCIVILIIVLIVFFVGTKPLVEGGYIDSSKHGVTKYRCVGAACYMTQQDLWALQQQKQVETRGHILQPAPGMERRRIYLPTMDLVPARPLRPVQLDRIPIPPPRRYEEQNYNWHTGADDRPHGVVNNALDTDSSDESDEEITTHTQYVSQAPRVVSLMPPPVLPQPMMARPIIPMPRPVMQPVAMMAQPAMQPVMMAQPVMMTQPVMQPMAMMPQAVMMQTAPQQQSVVAQVHALPRGPTTFYAPQGGRATEYEEQERHL